MALGVVEVFVTRKGDEVVYGKWRLGLVEHNGEVTLVCADYCRVGLIGIKTVTWSIFKCGCANFTAINGWARGVASDRATLDWCWRRGGQGGVA